MLRQPNSAGSGAVLRGLDTKASIMCEWIIQSARLQAHEHGRWVRPEAHAADAIGPLSPSRWQLECLLTCLLLNLVETVCRLNQVKLNP